MLSTGYYIADARSQDLPLLIEGSEHDWAYILGTLGLHTVPVLYQAEK